MPHGNPPLAGGLDRAWRIARTNPWPARAALCLLAIVSYLPAVLWGRLHLGRPAHDRHPGGAGSGRAAADLVLSGRDRSEGHYWPLVYSLFWLQHKLWGFAPAGFHAVNVLLHAANTLLLWPAHAPAEGPRSVAGGRGVRRPSRARGVRGLGDRAQGRALRDCSTCRRCWRGSASRAEPRAGRYLTALGLYAAGMLAKSVVVTLPAALLIWHGGGGAASPSPTWCGRAVLRGGSADLGGGPDLQPVARRRRVRLLDDRARP